MPESEPEWSRMPEPDAGAGCRVEGFSSADGGSLADGMGGRRPVTEGHAVTGAATSGRLWGPFGYSGV